MENKGKVENRCFKLCILFIFSQKHEYDLCCGKLWIRNMNYKALIAAVVVVCLITVNGKEKEYGNKLQALS